MGLFSPLLSRIGYGLPWRNSTVMIWGGLRGAVGLTLALIVAQEPDLDPTGRVQQKVRETMYYVVLPCFCLLTRD
jgi:NhaP-type Na+/H+ or K+/H+ antiporter